MKQISAFQLSLTFVGVFLGAGFVSGQEIWQFFACFGPLGFLGFLMAIALFYLVHSSLIRLVRATGRENISYLLTPGDRPGLRAVVNGMQYLFLFGVVVIMTAGAAAILTELLGLDIVLASVMVTVIILLLALLGLQGLVTAFSLLVPVIAVCAVVIALLILFKNGAVPAPAAGSVSRLLPNWGVSALTYTAYNLLGTVTIIVPLAPLIRDERTLRRGLGGGAALLTLMAWSMIAALVVLPETGNYELPMNHMAAIIHPLLEIVYGVLMLLAMIVAALGCLVALQAQLELEWPKLAFHHRLSLVLVLAVSCAASLLGFGALIGVVYPIFGYASIPFFVCLLTNWRREKKKQPAA